MNHRNTNYTNNENRKIENIDPNKDENKNLNVDKIIHHDKYQLPVVALSFNFIQPSNTGLLYNKISNLSLSDIETLHHEWGHALHSLLSRTTFQHLSGTRGATDFVEVQDLEYYFLLSFLLLFSLLIFIIYLYVTFFHIFHFIYNFSNFFP